MSEPRQRLLRGAVANEDVRLVQLALRDAGFDPGKIDSVYGRRTSDAVRAFQKAKKLTVDGLVGPETWTALAAEPSGGPMRKVTPSGILHGAVSGNDVLKAQRALIDAGLDPGRTDGVYGPDTARAVAEFQRSKGLREDGVTGPRTWSKLLEAEAAGLSEVDDLSGSVAALRKSLRGRVSAHVIVAELLAGHDGYGANMAPSVEIGESPEAAETRTIDDWIKAIRPLFVPQDPGKLDGRKVIYGLALLDQDLRQRLRQHGFIDALEREIVVQDQLSGRGRALRKADAVPTLSDRPAEVDLLGRKAFAEALAARLRDEFERTERSGRTADSFMLHLEGPWGSGKTSLLGFLRDELRRAPQPWLVVDFNAWQNQRAGAPWWLLTSAVLHAAVEDKYTDTTLRLRLRLRAIGWRLQLAKAQIAVVILAGAVVTGLALTGRLTSDDPLGVLVGTISSVVAAVGGIHGLISSVTGGSERGARTFISQTRDPMNSMKRRFNRLVGTIGRPIAIFIDDLDRCRADYVVDLLEGVQTIFRDAPVAFVVAADRHWLYDAYAKIYGDYVKAAVDPGRPLGHLFLEKTFQLSTSVPKISTHDQRAFWNQLLSPPEDDKPADEEELTRKAEQDFAELRTEDSILGELDRNPGDTPRENRARREAAVRRLSNPILQQHIEHTLTPLAPLLEPNPRAMKRLVNAYGVERAVQILDGHSVELEHPREVLALWTILKLRWPLLADYLSEHPETLEDLRESRIPAALQDDQPSYIKTFFEDPAAGRVARGEGVDGGGLDPRTLRFLIEGPGSERTYD